MFKMLKSSLFAMLRGFVNQYMETQPKSIHFLFRMLTLHTRESITKVTFLALAFIRTHGVRAVSVTVTLVLTFFTFVYI